MVELRAFKVNKLEVENTVAPGTQLKLQNQVKYNVNYMDGEYVQRMSFSFDCRCFFGTAISALIGDGVVEGGTGELHRMENKK